jgi:hypothetical protein
VCLRTREEYVEWWRLPVSRHVLLGSPPPAYAPCPASALGVHFQPSPRVVDHQQPAATVEYELLTDLHLLAEQLADYRSAVFEERERLLANVKRIR